MKHGTPAPPDEYASIAPVNRGRGCSRCSIKAQTLPVDGKGVEFAGFPAVSDSVIERSKLVDLVLEVGVPAKTSSPSNATAPAPSKASKTASCNASSASPPASPATTNSDARAAHWSTTSPNRVESTI
jgi:hypothetical protein